MLLKRLRESMLSTNDWLNRGVISKRRHKKLKISEIADNFMDRAEVAIEGGGAMVAVLPDSTHRVDMGEYSKRYNDIKHNIAE